MNKDIDLRNTLETFRGNIDKKFNYRSTNDPNINDIDSVIESQESNDDNKDFTARISFMKGGAPYDKEIENPPPLPEFS